MYVYTKMLCTFLIRFSGNWEAHSAFGRAAPRLASSGQRQERKVPQNGQKPRFEHHKNKTYEIVQGL